MGARPLFHKPRVYIFAKNLIKKADAVIGSKRLIGNLAEEKNEKYLQISEGFFKIMQNIVI